MRERQRTSGLRRPPRSIRAACLVGVGDKTRDIRHSVKSFVVAPVEVRSVAKYGNGWTQDKPGPPKAKSVATIAPEIGRIHCRFSKNDDIMTLYEFRGIFQYDLPRARNGMNLKQDKHDIRLQMSRG